MLFKPASFSLISIREVDAQLFVLPVNLQKFVENGCSLMAAEDAGENFVLAAEL
jgi:hypothetical protein